MKISLFETLRNERGHIVVETVGTFLPFVLLVISILSLVNIVSAQARIHFALSQTAITLSMYSHALWATGATDGLSAHDSGGNVSTGNISAVSDGINSLLGGGGGSGLAISFSETIEEIASYGVGRLQNYASGQLLRPLLLRYLRGTTIVGEEYLQLSNVRNFHITEVFLIDRYGRVRLTVEYDVDYTFGALRLPFGPSLSVTQTVVTKAWLGGSGEGYRG